MIVTWKKVQSLTTWDPRLCSVQPICCSYSSSIAVFSTTICCKNHIQVAINNTISWWYLLNRVKNCPEDCVKFTIFMTVKKRDQNIIVLQSILECSLFTTSLPQFFQSLITCDKGQQKIQQKCRVQNNVINDRVNSNQNICSVES